MPAYDVAVIGAGIIGCASAWRLAQRGLRVAVLERESAPATGSTGRSAAGVRLQFSDATNILLSAHSLREYREMPEAAFRPIGYLFMVPEEHWPAHRAAVALQRELGAPVQVLSPEQATHVVPADIRGLGGATWCAQDGIVDPHGICLAYAARARACGAIVMLRAGVEAIDERPDGWVIHAGRERLRAATIVNAE
jgi:sarcosine oxidase subunit beta